MVTLRAGRTSVSLDGMWGFVHRSDGVARQTLVPQPWQGLLVRL